MSMDARSEAVLAHVDPVLADLVRKAAATLVPKGIFLCVYEGYRTAAEQNALFAQGRTTPGPMVTKARAGHSNHNYGMAVDVVPYLHGSSGALNWEPKAPAFEAMVAAMKAQGLAYGGDWKTFPDDDHFQLATMPASPTPVMIADLLASKPLTDIWARCAAGDYQPIAHAASGTVDA